MSVREKGMHHCKITILKKMVNQDIIDEYTGDE
jgi:hypothetical protein